MTKYNAIKKIEIALSKIDEVKQAGYDDIMEISLERIIQQLMQYINQKRFG